MATQPKIEPTERQWEAQFRLLPTLGNARNYMQRLTAHPHHVGSAYDEDNAQWILANSKSGVWMPM